METIQKSILAFMLNIIGCLSTVWSDLFLIYLPSNNAGYHCMSLIFEFGASYFYLIAPGSDIFHAKFRARWSSREVVASDKVFEPLKKSRLLKILIFEKKNFQGDIHML